MRRPCAQGNLAYYSPLSASRLNVAEAIQPIVTRVFTGQHAPTPAEISIYLARGRGGKPKWAAGNFGRGRQMA